MEAWSSKSWLEKWTWKIGSPVSFLQNRQHWCFGPAWAGDFHPKLQGKTEKHALRQMGINTLTFSYFCQKTLNCQLRLLFLPWIELNFLCCTRDVEGAAAVSSFVGESSRRNFTFLKRSRRREKKILKRPTWTLELLAEQLRKMWIYFTCKLPFLEPLFISFENDSKDSQNETFLNLPE